jgi:hypothetical protein
MMIVADVARSDASAMEDAIEAAWQLQRSVLAAPARLRPDCRCQWPGGRACGLAAAEHS